MNGIPVFKKFTFDRFLVVVLLSYVLGVKVSELFGV